MAQEKVPASISPEERAALLAVLPGAGKERPAIHAHTAAIYARLSMLKKDDKRNGKHEDKTKAYTEAEDSCMGKK